MVTKMITLYHGSPRDCGDTLTVQFVGDDNYFIFDGVFCSDFSAAQSHGDYIYTIDISSQDILDNMFFYDYENTNITNTALHKIIKFTENDYDMLYDALCLEKYDAYDEKWLEILSISDMDYVGWELQNLRGRLAAKLGFKAAEMQDEHGTSYLVLPGNTLYRVPLH